MKTIRNIDHYSLFTHPLSNNKIFIKEYTQHHKRKELLIILIFSIKWQKRAQVRAQPLLPLQGMPRLLSPFFPSSKQPFAFSQLAAYPEKP